MSRERFAQLHEGAHNEDAHLNRLLAVQHVGRHDCPVLGEGIR